jgi:ABC-2 type transport system permease protein
MSLLPNALHVARREYAQRARTRIFVIMTAILVVIALAISVAPAITRALGPAEPSRVGVMAGDEVAEQQIVASLRAVLNMESAAPPDVSMDVDPQPRFEVVAFDDAESAAAELQAGELAGLLTVTRDQTDELIFHYQTDVGPTARSPLLVQQAATSMAINDRLERHGVEPAEREAIFAPPAFEVERSDAEPPPQAAADFWPNYLLGSALIVLIFMAIVLYGNWVATSVAEEKSSRVMELLVTAATPRQLLVGKVLGTGAVGLTQYAAILLAAGIGLALHGPIEAAFVAGEPGPGVDLALSIPLLLLYGAFFMGGFLLYATLYAAVGSMVSRQEDVNQVAGPMVVFAMAGYFGAFFALNAIDAAWVAPLSWVPFFSPFLMTARMVLTTVPAWELAGSLIVLTLAVALALLLAARVYSAGVLLYGQKRTLRQVLRAARVSR